MRPIEGAVAHVFISYSRSDRQFVETLRSALSDRSKDTWIDWQDIQPTAEWMQEIFTAISAADAVIVVLSPQAATSTTCRREIAHAAELNKRIIPILCMPVDATLFPESIRSVQWIDLTTGAADPAKIDSLVRAIDTDLEWVRDHTRLLERANEWEQRGRNTGLLLRGANLEEAQAWLARASQKQPTPTQSQIQLVVESRAHARRVQRIAFGAVGAGLLIAIVLAGVALLQRNAAREQQTIAESREFTARAINAAETDPLRALLLAIEAGQKNPTDAVADVLGRVLELPRVVIIVHHGGPIHHGSFSPDGKLLLTGASGGKARLWKTEDGTEVRVLDARKGKITHVQFSPSGKEALTIDGSARLWNLSDGRQLREFSAHDDPIESAVFGQDGRILTTVSFLGTVRQWNVENGALIGTPLARAWTLLVGAAAFSPVSSILALQESLSGTVYVGDASNGRELRRFAAGPTSTLRHLNGLAPVFSPDGQILAIGNESFGVQLIRTSDWARLADIKVEPGSSIRSVSFRSDGKVLVDARADGTAHFWTITGQDLGFVSGHDGQVNHATFSFNGELVLTTGEDGSARVWSLAGGGASHTLIGHKALINRVKVSPDSKLILTAGSDKAARLWDAESGQELRTWPATDEVFDAEFSPDGQLAVLASRDGTATLLRISDGRVVATLRGHRDAIMNVVFTRDSKQILTTGSDNAVRLWSAENGSLVRTLQTEGLPGDRATYSPDGRLVLASEGKLVRLWRSLDGEPVRSLSGHTDTVNDSIFSPDGQLIATASNDRTVRLWNVSDDGVRTMVGHTDGVRRVAFDPSSSWLASAGGDGTVRLWNVKKGEPAGLLSGHRGMVIGVRFSANGRYLLSHSLDSTVRVWNVAAHRLLRVLSPQAVAMDACFSPDGQMIVAAGNSGIAYIYPATVEGLLRLAVSRLPRNLAMSDREQLLAR